MGRLLKWLFLILLFAFVAMFIWFGMQDTEVERTTVEQEIDAETLGL
ncbi:MAG: hypothetical protein WA906_02105 [Pacificimonas sp.]